MCQGCSEAAWVIVVLLLVLVAAAGYALGRLRARLVHETALRAARATARQLAALQDNWAWQTDAGHRLVSWQGPGQATLSGSIGEAAALLSQAALAPQLHGEQAFADVPVHSEQALQGSHGWLLRGVPRHDDLGGFAGFAGTARPTDAETDLRCAAGALSPLLAALNAPALLALDSGAGWRLLQANAAAQAQWPGLQRGAALDDLIAGLPPALVLALSADHFAAIDAGAWTLSPLPGLPSGRRGLLLSQTAQASAASEADRSAMAESDNFSFTVSHDLRAPIRVVEGFTRILKEDYGRLLDRVGNDHLDRVLGAAARMNLMIDALLTLARLSSQPLARQPVNLSQLAGYVVDDLKRASPEREADVQIEPDLVTRGDPTLLRLVLENLLGNAWKYSARAPRTQISLRQVAHQTAPHGTAYVVRDNGAGFDMRSADRLFGLFQRLHSASEFPGHGVGLASVRRIVRRHGGEIWAEAEPGRGAAFFFTLA